MPIVSSIITIIILGFTFTLIDGIASKPEPFKGYVVDMHYKGESNSSGAGYGITSSGKSGIIVASEFEEGMFLIIVKTEKGEVVTVECDPELYYKKVIGDKIDCVANKGYFTGISWSLQGIR